MSACRNWRFRFDPEDDTHMPLLPLPYAEIPMVLGFSGWHPCLSVTNRLVDRRQFGSLVRSLARPLPVVVHSLVQSPTRSRARSLPPFSSLSLFVFRLPALPLVSTRFHNFQTFIIHAVLDSSDASLPPLSVGNRIVQFNWSRGKVERESNENCLVLFYLSCLRGYSRGVSLSFPRRER